MKIVFIIAMLLLSGHALAGNTTSMLTGGAAGYLVGSMNNTKGGRAPSQIEVRGVPYMCNADGPWCRDILDEKVSIVNACRKYGKFKASGFVPVSERLLIIICMRTSNEVAQ